MPSALLNLHLAWYLVLVLTAALMPFLVLAGAL